MRETAKTLQKGMRKSWVAKWSISTVLDRTAKKIIEKTKHKRGSSSKKNQQTTEEQRSAWICSNSLEIYVQQRMETLASRRKKATTFEQQTEES